MRNATGLVFLGFEQLPSPCVHVGFLLLEAFQFSFTFSLNKS